MENNETMTSPLRNVRVEVRFVPKENSRFSNPRHVMYGDLNENAKIKLSVPRLSSGQLANVLTNDEKTYFESLFGVNMSVYNKVNNYWEDSNEGFINTVTLSKRPTFLNLSQPEDYIKYKILRANSHIVAPSLSDLKTKHLVTYRFVLVEESEEREINHKETNVMMNAFMQLGAISKDSDKLRFIVEKLTKTKYSQDTDTDTFLAKAQDCIKDDPKAFIELAEDKLLDMKVLLKRAVAAGIVTYKGDYYYLTEGDIPLCAAGQKPTFEVAAKHISLAKNQEMKFLIEAKLNQ